jgi:hypothetical protein
VDLVAGVTDARRHIYAQPTFGGTSARSASRSTARDSRQIASPDAGWEVAVRARGGHPANRSPWLLATVRPYQTSREPKPRRSEPRANGTKVSTGAADSLSAPPHKRLGLVVWATHWRALHRVGLLCSSVTAGKSEKPNLRSRGRAAQGARAS